MKIENGNVNASSEELAAAISSLNLETNRLSRIPGVPFGTEHEEAVADFASQVHEDFGNLLVGSLETLAAPDRVGVLHYALGDESISRAILAWNAAALPGEVVLLVKAPDGWEIQRRTIESLGNTFSEILLAEEFPPRGSLLSRPISSRALPAFLVLCDLLREGRLFALLSHQVSSGKFTDAGLREALEAAHAEDFRWPSLFFDKLLPSPMSDLGLVENTGEILREWQNLELVQEVPGDAATYELTAAGSRIARALWHHHTLLGLRVTVEREDGSRGHEVFFLVRALHDLFLFDVAGGESVISSLSSGDLEALIPLLAGRAELVSSRPPEAEPDTKAGRAATRSCAACGEQVEATNTFCSACGMPMPGARNAPPAAEPEKPRTPVPRPEPRRRVSPAAPAQEAKPGPTFCTKCGAKLSPGGRFCQKCGNPVR